MFKHDLDHYSSKIVSSRQKTASGIQTHEKIVAANSQAVDPWLSERVLFSQLRDMIGTENNFQSEMNNLLQQFSIFDSHVAEELKLVMEEYAHCKNAHLAAMQTHLTRSAHMATVAESSAYFKKFASAHDLDNPNLWHTERTMEKFTWRCDEIQIIKRGLLYAPSPIFSDKWHPVHAVLTETGFLHLFKMSDSEHRTELAKYGCKDHAGTLTRFFRSMSKKSMHTVDQKPYQRFSFR